MSDRVKGLTTLSKEVKENNFDNSIDDKKILKMFLLLYAER